MLIVLKPENGSRRADVGSGRIFMSEALIGCQPRTDEPSKPRPSSKSSSERRLMGIVVCCQMPGRSMNFRSTNLQSWFLASWITSFGFMVFAFPPESLNSVLVPFASAYPYSIRYRQHEDLPVADAAGAGAFLDGVHHGVHQCIGNDDVDPHFGDEVHDVGRAAVDLFF